MKLFEITMTAYKTFYVEAETQEDALKHDAVDREQGSIGDHIDWDHNETTAEEIEPKRADFIRSRDAKLILPPDE